LSFGYVNFVQADAMNENRTPDNQSKTTDKKNSRLISGGALLMGLFALAFAAVVEPEPARAQLGDVGSFLGGAMRGMMGGGGHRYRYRGGGGHHHGAAYHMHSGVSVAHSSHSSGHHHAGGGGSSGPGGGSFH
jgi:hypothetical protein